MLYAAARCVLGTGVQGGHEALSGEAFVFSWTLEGLAWLGHLRRESRESIACYFWNNGTNHICIVHANACKVDKWQALIALWRSCADGVLLPRHNSEYEEFVFEFDASADAGEKLRR